MPLPIAASATVSMKARFATVTALSVSSPGTTLEATISAGDGPNPVARATAVPTLPIIVRSFFLCQGRAMVRTKRNPPGLSLGQ
mmetsp:Transcript_38037/g.82742  ORF Transcript_38037/g.82742 Transcript_38037/m.82742 type:complete len:84 (+) Transcript_38037:882-1133(+)